MTQPDIRKIVVLLEETRKEMERAVNTRKAKVAVAAVLRNPLAGRYVEDLEVLKELGRQIGGVLARRGVEALGVEPGKVESYGKGAIVGVDGEIEHTAALLHPRFGAPVRAAVEHGDDIIPGTKKMGGPGSSITIPLTHKDNIWDFDHMDAMDITVPDAPKAHEIVVVAALGIGGRPLNRTRPD
ncbi:MAG: amino acid synthesis family protein [Gammaproteobacteria bacterium]|nr:amino acid synthesis family protein [Gammaproteobacteria bacterium]